MLTPSVTCLSKLSLCSPVLNVLSSTSCPQCRLSSMSHSRVKVNGAESEMRGKWNWNGRKLKWDMNNQLKANAGIIDVATDESIGRRIVRKWRNRKRRLVWVERLPSPPPDHLRVEWGQQEERVKAWKWEERTFYGPPKTKWYKLFVKSTWCKYPLWFSTFQKHWQGWDLSDLRTFRHSDGEIYTIWVYFLFVKIPELCFCMEFTDTSGAPCINWYAQFKRRAEIRRLGLKKQYLLFWKLKTYKLGFRIVEGWV